jgi:bacterioferritin-associated ferredoxin
MYVCICRQVTDRDIRDAVVNEGARSMRDLQRGLGVASCCGCCAPCAREVLAVALREREVKTARAETPLLPAPAALHAG